MKSASLDALYFDKGSYIRLEFQLVNEDGSVIDVNNKTYTFIAKSSLSTETEKFNRLCSSTNYNGSKLFKIELFAEETVSLDDVLYFHIVEEDMGNQIKDIILSGVIYFKEVL